MTVSATDEALIILRATLTERQLTCIALLVAEAELKRGIVDSHEFRSAIVLGLLSGLGVDAAKIETAKSYLQQRQERPALSLIGGMH